MRAVALGTAAAALAWLVLHRGVRVRYRRTGLEVSAPGTAPPATAPEPSRPDTIEPETIEVTASARARR
jgi:hypothetical protein